MNLTAANLSTTTRRFAAAIILAVLFLVAVSPRGAVAGGGEPPAKDNAAADPAASASNSPIDIDAAEAFAKDKGISVAEAKQRLAKQKPLGDKGRRMEKSLKGRSGGSYLDANGNLVVTTLDPAADKAVKENGAKAQRVDDSTTRLNSIMRQLNKASEQGSGSLQGWHVDVPSNTVVVTVTKGAKDGRTSAMLRLAEKFGSSVRVEQAPADQAPRPAAYLVGGFEIYPPNSGACSVGFNTVDAYNRDVVLTAGHCVKSTGTVSRQGYWIGNVRNANYPGDDFGTFWNSYPSYWQPSVSVYKYNSTYVNVRGQWNVPPVGATVCKSGRTTGYTCGAITALNQTVVYTGGYTLYGLVRHNACVEGGDSGGSNISAGAYALGVTSGASMTSGGLCKQKVGSPNVSFYQPIGEALSRNGLRLRYQP